MNPATGGCSCRATIFAATLSARRPERPPYKITPPMPYDPTLPIPGAIIDADELRAQFHGLDAA